MSPLPPEVEGGPRALTLQIRDLSKQYGNVKALDGVSFELRAGEVMALLGENGAGKSTLVKVLAGLVEPDGGEIFMDGTPTKLHPVSASHAAGIAVVHQEFSSVPALTVAENIALGDPASRRLWWPPRLRRSARDLLPRVGLAHVDPRTRVERLSVAEQQLLEIARVLARDAKIVIFDEPTAALADHDIERVLAAIARLAREGRSVIYVTHRLPEVFNIADRITIFRNGRGLAPIDVGDTTPERVIESMLGRRLDTMYPSRGAVAGDPLVEISDLRTTGLAEPISLTVRKGEILGLTGQLGSGVDEILKALAGLADGATGRVTLDGREMPLRGRLRGIRDGVAYCSADRKVDGIFADVSITQNLSSPWLGTLSRSGVLRLGRERTESRALASQFAIDANRLNATVGSLSGGNQQKVAVGKWLGIAPKLLLVEEPTRGVDVGARAEIYERLRELSSDGCAIVVASSDTSEVLGLCDTIGTLYRRRLTALRQHEAWTEEQLALEVMHTPAAVTT